MSATKAVPKAFFYLGGGSVATLLELCLAKLFAEFDELTAQSPEAPVLGNLLASAFDGMRRDGAGDGLAAGLEGQGPVRAMAGGVGGGAAATGLAAAAEAVCEGAGAHGTHRSELMAHLLESVLEG